MNPIEADLESNITFFKKKNLLLNEQTQNFKQLNKQLFENIQKSQKLLFGTLCQKSENSANQFDKKYEFSDSKYSKMIKKAVKGELNGSNLTNLVGFQIRAAERLFHQIQKPKKEEKELNTAVRKLVTKSKKLQRQRNAEKDLEIKKSKKLRKLIIKRDKESRKRDFQMSVDELEQSMSMSMSSFIREEESIDSFEKSPKISKKAFLKKSPKKNLKNNQFRVSKSNMKPKKY